MRERLESEAGTIGWHELAREFARGVVVRVAGGLDLIDVAEVMARDDKAGFEALSTGGRVARASDDDARGWVEREPVFRCVVVAPWVLVQELAG